MKDGVSKVTQIRKERSLEELVNTRVGEVPLAPSLNDCIQEPEVHHHQIARLQKGVLLLCSHIRYKALGTLLLHSDLRQALQQRTAQRRERTRPLGGQHLAHGVARELV